MPPTRRGRDRELRRNERRRRAGVLPGGDTTLPEDITPGGGAPGGGAPGGGTPGGGGGGATPGTSPAPAAPAGTPSAPTGASRLGNVIRRIGNRLLGQ